MIWASLRGRWSVCTSGGSRSVSRQHSQLVPRHGDAQVSAVHVRRMSR